MAGDAHPSEVQSRIALGYVEVSVNLQSYLSEVIAEVDRAHPSGGPVTPDFFDEGYLPTFYTAKTGDERHFSRRAVDALRRFTLTVYQNDASMQQSIRANELMRLSFQSFADLHAEGQFKRNDGFGIAEFVKLMSDRLRESVTNSSRTFTHYFPAWTFGVERSQTFAVGPVVFLDRSEWIASLPDDAIEHLVQFESHRFPATTPTEWRNRLMSALESETPPELGVFGKALFDGIKSNSSILKVTVIGSERRYSRELGQIAAQAALDSLALLFDDDEAHRTLVLHGQPRPPFVTGVLAADELGRLLPNTEHKHPGWRGSEHAAALAVRDGHLLVEACGLAITALLDEASHPAPRLARRWLTSLMWFGEGCREPRDSVALAKLASALDILAGGKEEHGIKQLLSHLMGIPETKVLTVWPERTLKKLVEDIYRSGRSQILHGNHTDPMRSFSVDRHHASALGRIALREAVVRWASYRGPDDDGAFRSIADAGMSKIQTAI